MTLVSFPLGLAGACPYTYIVVEMSRLLRALSSGERSASVVSAIVSVAENSPLTSADYAQHLASIFSQAVCPSTGILSYCSFYQNGVAWKLWNAYHIKSGLNTHLGLLCSRV